MKTMEVRMCADDKSCPMELRHTRCRVLVPVATALRVAIPALRWWNQAELLGQSWESV